MRAPVYQSSSALLTVAPAAIDEPEAQVSQQQIAVQRQALLDPLLLEDVVRRLREGSGPGEAARLTQDGLRGMLSVESVAKTNVLELRARGSDAAVLEPAVSHWIDAYQALRVQDAVQRKDQATRALEEETGHLADQIAAKRRELDSFSRANGILSKNDADNQAIARLNGLNAALNKASDEEVLAKSKLDAVEAAVAKGDPVVPPREEQGLAQLQFSAHLLREQVKGIEQRYTPEYVKMQPDLRAVREQLAQAEADIRKMLDEGKEAALSEARQAYASARQSTQAIRAQTEAHKREASEFTARFAEHESMAGEIEKLEEVYRKVQARLSQLQANPVDKLPRIEVVERPHVPTKPLWPDYWRDSGIALLGSLGAALLTTLLFDFLTRREKAAAPINLPDIHVYSVPENLLLQRRQQVPVGAGLPDSRVLALESPFPRELGPPEIDLLLEAASPATRPLLGLLLSGLSLEEAAALGADGLDLTGDRLRAGGRELPLAPRLKGWLEQAGGALAWASEAPPEPDELEAHIACAAADAGLPEPDSVDAAALRHTYILYLVRRGLRLADLERVVGKMPVKAAAAYARFSPPGQALRAEAVPLTHPALAVEDGVESSGS
jgi:uncharacterized protein involved in exopolysaccharide biosynthesis